MSPSTSLPISRAHQSHSIKPPLPFLNSPSFPPPLVQSLNYTNTMYNSASPYNSNDPSAFFSSSIPSNTNNSYFVHRSSSTQSFNPHHSCSVPNPIPTPFFSNSNTSSDFLVLNSQPVRRVFSTGDLQGIPSLENCGQEGVGIGGRVGRYTAEERMKRIERYRSKRNQRNFHKKITYACRKTLADSRPRVRGRFARNSETEAETDMEAEASVSENTYEIYNHNSKSASENSHENGSYYNNYDDDGSNNIEWWGQLYAALGPTDKEDECRYGEEMLANIESVFLMNLLS